MWKFFGKAQFPHSFGRVANCQKLLGNCAFPQNFPTKKLCETTVFCAVWKNYVKQNMRQSRTDNPFSYFNWIVFFQKTLLIFGLSYKAFTLSWRRNCSRCAGGFRTLPIAHEETFCECEKISIADLWKGWKPLHWDKWKTCNRL